MSGIFFTEIDKCFTQIENFKIYDCFCGKFLLVLRKKYVVLKMGGE